MSGGFLRAWSRWLARGRDKAGSARESWRRVLFPLQEAHSPSAWGKAGWKASKSRAASCCGGKLDLFEEARIIELLGVSFHFAEVQRRVRLQPGGPEQLLLRVLRCTLKADRLRPNLFLCEQRKRAKQKQSYTECARL